MTQVSSTLEALAKHGRVRVAEAYVSVDHFIGGRRNGTTH
jgi:hypothetical protein